MTIAYFGLGQLSRLTLTILVFSGVALTATAGAAAATDAAVLEPGVSRSSPDPVEFLPMTRSERFRLFLNSSFGFGSMARAAFQAEIHQIKDAPKEWDGGFKGYTDRFGNAYARHIIRQSLEYGVSSALHEDDRYLASGETGFWRRTKYAIASGFLARRDNGQRAFAFARVGSAAGAAFISRAWQPASTSSAANAAGSFGITMVSDMGTNIFREFWPDLKRRFRRK